MAVFVQQRGREEVRDSYPDGVTWETTDHGVLEVKDNTGKLVGAYHRDVWARAWTVTFGTSAG